jgi:hypothetical protein
MCCGGGPAEKCAHGACHCDGAGIPCPTCCDPIPEDGTRSIGDAFTPQRRLLIATGFWCEFCKQLVEPEWRAVAGVEVAMHRHGDDGHGCHRAEVESWGDGGTAIHAYEVVVRENGQYGTVEPGELIR